MCGIAGYITEGGPPDRTLIEGMCDTLAHRGPDGKGYYVGDRVALGHRRLSVIDLSSGQQPIGNEDGTVQVVFNGEIYNYRDLRKNLIASGHRFSTTSDTEVLVHLYEELGERLVEELNGMFAFAIWDAARQQLMVARDRFGEKPLYYSFETPGMTFCFASELKAFARVPGFGRRINPRSIANFLALSYIPDPDCIYENVAKLEAGHTLLVTCNGAIKRRYWELQFSESETDLHEAAEKVATLSRDAVQRRMISDVPLGSFLSGGIDSSSVTALMALNTSKRVSTFSIGFTDRRFDELPFARLVASRCKTEHHEEVVTPQIHEVLDTLVDHFDEPFGDSSAIPMLYLSRMTRRHVTVALSGDGADELFGGYRQYYFGVLEQRFRSLFPAWFRKSLIRLGGELYPKFDYLPQVFRAK